MAAFIFQVKTDNLGTSSNNQYILPVGTGTFSYTVDWGDGTAVESFTTDSDQTHTYSAAGTYDITIDGTFPHMDQEGITGKDPAKLIDVLQWGTIVWESMDDMFRNCSNITTFTATDTPDLSNVTNMGYMFFNAYNFNSDISAWDTSGVTDMGALFWNSSFNQPLDNWDTSSVTNMAAVFRDTPFNQPLNNWDVSNVTEMISMFWHASSFNQPLDNWDISSVTNMSYMFRDASSFNQPLDNWDVSNVTDFTDMLSNSGLSIQNYELTLIGWSKLPSLQTGVSLGADGLEYRKFAEDERQSIIDSYNWTITGDTLVNTPIYNHYELVEGGAASVHSSYDRGLSHDNLEPTLSGSYASVSNYGIHLRTKHAALLESCKIEANGTGDINLQVLEMDGGSPADPGTVSGGALEFDGVDDYVELPDISISPSMSYSAWVQSYDVSLQRQYIMTLQVNPPSTASYTYKERQGFHLSGNSFDAQYWMGGDNNGSISSGPIISNGVWYHIALVIDASGGKLYVDGSLVDSSEDVPEPLEPNQCLIGARLDDQGDDFMNGLIADPHIYNRALSQAEIQRLYYGDPSITEGLVGYWPFDEGSGTTAYDKSGNNNDGTLNGGPTWSTSPTGSHVDATVYNIPPSAGASIFPFDSSLNGLDSVNSFIHNGTPSYVTGKHGNALEGGVITSDFNIPDNDFSIAKWGWLPSILIAQEPSSTTELGVVWETSITDDYGDIELDSNKNIYVTRSPQLLTKFDSSGTEVWTIDFGDYFYSSPRALKISSDGYLYVGTSTSGEIHKFQLDGTEITIGWPYTGHSGNINQLDADSSGNIYSGSFDDTVRKIASDGTEQWVFSVHTDTVNSIAVSSGGYVYSGSSDNTIRKIDAATGLEITTGWPYTDHSDNVFSVGVDSIGNIYSGSADETVRKIAPDGSLIWSFTDSGSAITSIDVNSDAIIYYVTKELVFGSTGHNIKRMTNSGFIVWVYDSYNNSISNIISDNEQAVYATPDFGESVRKIALLEKRGLNTTIGDLKKNLTLSADSGNVKWADGTANSQVWSFSSVLDRVFAVTVDSNGNVYTGAGASITKIDSSGVEVTTGGWPFTGHTNTISGLIADSSGNYIYSCGFDGMVYKLDSTGNQIWSFNNAVDLSDIALDNSGNVYIGEFQPPFSIKKIDSSGVEVTTGGWPFTGHTSTVFSLNIGPDGYLYSGSRDTSARKIDVDGNQIWSFTGSTGYVHTVTSDIDGYAYTASGDGSGGGTVRKVDSSGVEVTTGGWPFTGHTLVVEAVTVDSEGYVYSGSPDQTVRKLDPTGVEVWSFAYPDEVYDVVTDNNGYIYVGGYPTVKKIEVRAISSDTFTPPSAASWHHYHLVHSGTDVTLNIDGTQEASLAGVSEIPAAPLEIDLGADSRIDDMLLLTENTISQSKIDEYIANNQPWNPELLRRQTVPLSLYLPKAGDYFLYKIENTSLLRTESGHTFDSNDEIDVVEGKKLDGTSVARHYWFYDIKNYSFDHPPVGWWQFDEGEGDTAYDSSGEANNGTLVGGPTWTTGPAGGALSFDGVDDYVALSSLIEIAGDFAVSNWIKITDPSTTDSMFWGEYGVTSTFAIIFSGDDVQLATKDDAETRALWSNTGVDFSQWRHIVFVRDGTSVELFIDGQSYGTQSLSNNITINAIGTGWFNSTYHIDGLIADLRIYDRALSAIEIKALYNSPTTAFSIDHLNSSRIAHIHEDHDNSTHVDSSTHLWALNKEHEMVSDELFDNSIHGLVGFWSFDEEEGNIAYDSSGVGNNGNLIGYPRWTSWPGRSETLYFNGSEAIQLGNPDPLNFGSGDPFTLSIWQFATTGNDGALFGKYLDGANSSIILMDSGTSTKFIINDGTGSSLLTLTAPAPSRFSWNHVLVTFDGTNATIYLNGEAANNGIASAQFPGNVYEWAIGKRGESFFNFYTGNIAEPRMYNRELTSLEVRTLYDITKPMG